MGAPLAQPSDVEDLWRPLAADETARVSSLIAKASALLRQIVPAVDERIGLFQTDPSSPRALDPILVADVVATAVKNFVNNPSGVATETESVGPYSHSTSFLARGEKSNPAGQLMYTQELLDRLQPGLSMSELYSSIRTRPDGWTPPTWDANRKPYDGNVWDEFYGENTPYREGLV